MKKCIECGIVLDGRATKYCSRRCRTKKYQEARTCVQCGKTYMIDRSDRNRFCSRACRGKAQSLYQAGVNNPTWKGGLATYQCKKCGADYQRPRCVKPGFCSAACRDTGRPVRPNNRGSRETCAACGKELWVPLNIVKDRTTPGNIFFGKYFCNRACRTRFHKIDLTCGECGAAFSIRLSRFNAQGGKVPFCGQECYGAWRSRSQFGPDNSAWQGGTILMKEYGPLWPAARRKTLVRDKYCCRVCGKHKSQLKPRQLGVHHRIKFRVCRRHEQKNLVTLCTSCHKKVEHSKIPCPENSA